tara:strand:+ start:148 stop:1002 length:855 start_codon:yes stop_codon:yes gene_type:complete
MTNNLLDQRIQAATSHREDSDTFFIDSRVADNINNMNNINLISAIPRISRLKDCHSEEVALQRLTPSASLTSPSERSLQSVEESGEGSVEGQVKGQVIESSATREDGDLQVDPNLPVKMVKVDLIDTEKYAVTVNITNTNGGHNVLKAHMNTHKKHWKRLSGGVNIRDVMPEHTRLVDECVKQNEQDSFWDVVRVSKFLKYEGSVSKNKTFRQSTPGLTGVLCYNTQSKTAVLHFFIKEYHATIILDKDLTPKQMKTGYLGSGMLVKKAFSRYVELNVDELLGL